MIIPIGVPDDFDVHCPAPVVEELHVRKSARDNGYEVECRIFGRSMGGLRCDSITVGALAYIIQQYAKTAWAASKRGIVVDTHKMTIDRGGNDAT